MENKVRKVESWLFLSVSASILKKAKSLLAAIRLFPQSNWVRRFGSVDVNLVIRSKPLQTYAITVLGLSAK